MLRKVVIAKAKVWCAFGTDWPFLAVVMAGDSIREDDSTDYHTHGMRFQGLELRNNRSSNKSSSIENCVGSFEWEPIALGYISNTITIAHTFITDLLNLACPDNRVRDGLM